MTQPELILRLLHLALVDIRAAGRDAQNRLLFELADLLHVVPLQLEQIAQGEGSYDDALERLSEHAKAKGVQDWIDRALVDYRRHRDFEQQQSTRTTRKRSLPQNGARDQLYHLLYLALIDLRMEALQIQNQQAFCLADICHNIPLTLKAAAEGTLTYDEILAELHERARLRGCEEWLNQAMQRATSHSENDLQK